MTLIPIQFKQANYAFVDIISISTCVDIINSKSIDLIKFRIAKPSDGYLPVHTIFFDGDNFYQYKDNCMAYNFTYTTKERSFLLSYISDIVENNSLNHICTPLPGPSGNPI